MRDLWDARPKDVGQWLMLVPKAMAYSLAGVFAVITVIAAIAGPLVLIALVLLGVLEASDVIGD